MMRFVLSLVLALGMLALTSMLIPTLGAAGSALAADTGQSTQTQPFEQYPSDAVKGLYEGCVKAKGLPADKAKEVCSCYTVLLQVDVPYSVFKKANADLKARGFDGLDADGKLAMEKNGYVVDYCRLKKAAAGTAEERGTFPPAALPALHQSCMDFGDVAADKKEQFCGCYENQVRTQMSYSDWRLLSLALQTKGLGRLDGEETRIFDVVRAARLGCGGTPAK